MSTDYKPTLRFNSIETRRINVAAANAGQKPSEWLRDLILKNAPTIPIANPLAVRVDQFHERFGWNLYHCAETLTHAETTDRYGDVREIAEYIERFTTELNGERWIDGDKLPGVVVGDVSSVAGRAIDLCRTINRAHIRAEIARAD